METPKNYPDPTGIVPGTRQAIENTTAAPAFEVAAYENIEVTVSMDGIKIRFDERGLTDYPYLQLDCAAISEAIRKAARLPIESDKIAQAVVTALQTGVPQLLSQNRTYGKWHIEASAFPKAVVKALDSTSEGGKAYLKIEQLTQDVGTYPAINISLSVAPVQAGQRIPATTGDVVSHLERRPPRVCIAKSA